LGAAFLLLLLIDHLLILDSPPPSQKNVHIYIYKYKKKWKKFMRLWITHFTQLGLQLGWSLSLSPIVPWLYKLSCTESRRFNSYFFLFLFFLNSDVWLLPLCCWFQDGKAIQSSGIHNPTWSFFYLSLFSVCLSLPSVSLPLCIQSTLLHDFIKRITILSILLFLFFDFSLLFSYFSYFSFFYFQFRLVSSHFRTARIWIIYAFESFQQQQPFSAVVVQIDNSITNK
jgi:hypothetical protein